MVVDFYVGGALGVVAGTGGLALLLLYRRTQQLMHGLNEVRAQLADEKLHRLVELPAGEAAPGRRRGHLDVVEDTSAASSTRRGRWDA